MKTTFNPGYLDQRISFRRGTLLMIGIVAVVVARNSAAQNWALGYAEAVKDLATEAVK